MVLTIVKYGHPVLRQRGTKITTVTPEIRALVADMFQTMRAASGVGLAAQQVGKALMLLVADVRDSERPSTLEIGGKPVNVRLTLESGRSCRWICLPRPLRRSRRRR